MARYSERSDDWQTQNRRGGAADGDSDEWSTRRQYDQPQGAYGQRAAQQGASSGQRGDDGGRHDEGATFGQGYNRTDFGGGTRGYGDDGRFGNGGRDQDQGGRSEPGFMERAGDEVSSWFGDDQARQRRNMDSHRGKGPKGYVRSDDRIREDVNDRLSDDEGVDASDIEVSVEQGEVTLTGEVGSRQEKRMAEDCVERVAGVSHVQNNLRVRAAAKPSGGAAGSGTGPIVAGRSSSGL